MTLPALAITGLTSIWSMTSFRSCASSDSRQMSGIDQSVDIHTGLAAKSRQQGMAFERRQHRPRGLLADRSKPHGGVTQQLDHDAAEAGRNQRPELAVILTRARSRRRRAPSACTLMPSIRACGA